LAERYHASSPTGLNTLPLVSEWLRRASGFVSLSNTPRISRLGPRDESSTTSPSRRIAWMDSIIRSSSVSSQMNISMSNEDRVCGRRGEATDDGPPLACLFRPGSQRRLPALGATHSPNLEPEHGHSG